jgi:hypothetical protein
MESQTAGLPNLSQPDTSGQRPIGPQVPTDRADIDLLLRQVTELQTRADDADKPWYRTPSTTIPIVISALAVITSIAIPWVQDWQATKQQAQANLATVESLAEQMIDLRKQNAEQLALTSNPALVVAESGLLNAKEQVLREKAKTLLEDPQIAEKADPGAVRVIAGELGNSGDLELAKADLRGLLNRSDVGTWERAYANASLAYYEMSLDAKPAEVDDGRKRMKEAISFYQQQPGDYARENVVEAYAAWANQDLAVGDRPGAKEEIQAAQISLKRLSPRDTDAPFISNGLFSIERSAEDSQDSYQTDPDTNRWFGSWTVKNGPADQRSAFLIISLNRQTNLPDAKLDILERNALKESYVGSGAFLNPGTLRIDWQAIWRAATAPGFPPSQSLGYTMLSLNGSNALEMKTYLLGEPPSIQHATRGKD